MSATTKIRGAVGSLRGPAAMSIPARDPSNRAGRRIGNFAGTCPARARGTLSRSRGVRRNSGRKHTRIYFRPFGETTLRESSRGVSDRGILARCGPHHVVSHANNRNLVTGFRRPPLTGGLARDRLCVLIGV